VDAPALIAAIQTELRRHTWDTFVDNPPAIAQGGKGVVVVGCPACQSVARANLGCDVFSTPRVDCLSVKSGTRSKSGTCDPLSRSSSLRG